MRRLAALLILTVPVSLATRAGPTSAGQDDPGFATSQLLDRETTYRLYRQAAEQGDSAAQVLVGNMYLIGEGVPRDYAQAAAWYRRAAERGNAEAQYSLGLMHANGQGMPRDAAEAAKWYREAAERGNAEAQYDLGAMYEEGQGVPRDQILAHMYFDLAARNFQAAESRKTAVESRDRVGSGMTTAQVAEARRLALKWKPKKPE